MDSSSMSTSASTAEEATVAAAAASFDIVSGMIVPFCQKLFLAAVGLVSIVGGILYVKQDSLLYFPEIAGIPKQSFRNPRGYRSPEERQLPYENHKIPGPDGVNIHAWLLLHQEHAQQQTTTTATKRYPTIIFFHGNAGNIGLRLPNAMKMLQHLQANILMVEYRGYGDSDDTEPPTEAGLQKDAIAALQFCQDHPPIDPSSIFLFGRSLGGAVSFYLAHYAQQQQKLHHPHPQLPTVAGVMVENTFLSVSHMVDRLMPFLKHIKWLVLRIGWKSHLLVPTLDTPTLYLAGARDELVPHQHMQDLYKLQTAAGGMKRLVQMHIVRDGTHNETWLQGGPAYWQAMRDFMQKAMALQRQQQQQQQQLPSSNGVSSSLSSSTATTTTDSSTTCSTTTTTTTSTSSIPTMSSKFMDIVRGKTSEGTKQD